MIGSFAVSSVRKDEKESVAEVTHQAPFPHKSSKSSWSTGDGRHAYSISKRVPLI